MFTGIIDALGTVHVAERDLGHCRVAIATPYPDLDLGESVSINGVCLTVVSRNDSGSADFFVSAETLARSNLDRLDIGHVVNLERAVSLSTRLSGHMVQGHVDGKGRLASVTATDGAWLLSVSLPATLYGYCVEKGSIALNGISLTLNSVGRPDGSEAFEVGLTIIPHTWDHTNLHALSVGDELNVEVDVIAKYVERLCQPYLSR